MNHKADEDAIIMTFSLILLSLLLLVACTTDLPRYRPHPDIPICESPKLLPAVPRADRPNRNMADAP